ncbi:MAG: MMPL family transporter [Fuerstiella sp.]|nr:MMPL family transporter [Fuerstiella sp.]
MASTHGPSLRWYLVTVILFAVPPVLGLCGLKFATQPPDPWTTTANGISTPDQNRHGSNKVTNQTETDGGNSLPCVAVLQSDQLLRREVFEAVRNAIAEISTTLPNCRIHWCDDVPSRTGILLRPRSVIPGENASDQVWDRAFTRLKEHPLVAGHLLSKDSTTMLLQFSDSTAVAAQSIDSILSQHLDQLNVSVRLTGEILMLRDHQKTLHDWHYYVLGFATIVVTLCGLLMLRAPARSMAVAAGPISALALAFGWRYFLGLPFNELAAPHMPVFVLVLSFANSMHILLAVEEEYGHVRDPRKAAHLAMKRMLRPCFLTSLTTSLAFASLMISSQPMVYGFGRNAAVAISISFVGVATVMPLAAAICVRHRQPTVRQTNRRQSRWIQRPILIGVKFPTATTIVSLMLTGGFTYYSFVTLYPDDRLDLRLNRNIPSYQGLLQCDEKLGGLRQVTVTMTWPENTSNESLWDVLTSIQQQIADSDSFSEPLSILNALQLLSGEYGPQKLRSARRLARGYIANLWDIDQCKAVLEFHVPDRGVQYIQNDISALRTLLDHEESLHPGFTTNIGGESLDQSSIVRSTIGEMSWSVVAAAGAIILVIWVAYGNVKYGFYSILPNMFALTMTVAVRAWMAPSLDIASACAASICLGIGVDDTIHFLEAMRHARGRPGSRIQILNAGHLVGRALVITTFALLCGFATVFIAPLPTHRFFASMVVAMLPAALFGDLIILPAVLSLFRDHTAQHRGNDRENSHQAIEEDNMSAHVDPVLPDHADC